MAKDVERIDSLAKDWTASPAAMLALLDLVSGIELKGSRLMSYASHQADTDMGNTRFQAMQGEIRTRFVQMSSKLSFMQPDILALGAETFAAYPAGRARNWPPTASAWRASCAKRTTSCPTNSSASPRSPACSPASRRAPRACSTTWRPRARKSP